MTIRRSGEPNKPYRPLEGNRKVRISNLARGAIGVTTFSALLASCLAVGLSAAARPTPSNAVRSNAVRSNARPGFMDHVDAKTDLVYISDFYSIPAGDVNVFTPNGVQVGQITNGMAAPEGLFVDANRNLWVANETNVLVFPRGALSPSMTLTDPIGLPIDVTVCPDGTAYVADLYDLSNTNFASIQVYPPGQTTPTRSLTYSKDFRNPGVTCDAAGNVFVAVLVSHYLPNAGAVIEFPGGKQKGVHDLGIVFQDVYGIKPDAAGNLLVSDFVSRVITEYTEAGVPTGVQITTGAAQIFGLAVSSDGRYVLGADNDSNRGFLWSFPQGKVRRIYSCCSRIGLPMNSIHGVAFDPGQPGI
jgi:hypothetical protein